MKKFKKIMAVVLAISVAMAFTACNNSGKDGNSADKSSSADKQVYKVGMEPTFPPFDTTDANGDLWGFDVDMVKAIAEDQGFEVEFINLGFDALIPALQSGSIDIIASGMNSKDPERRKAVDFTETYYESGLVVAVTEDNSTIKSIEDFTSDMKVAAQIGTSSATEITKLKNEGKIKEAVILNGVNEAMMQLINGDVQAVINDKPVTEAYMASQPGKIKIVGEPLNSEEYAMAVKKDRSDLLGKLNEGLANLKQNGKYDALITDMDKYTKTMAVPVEN